MNLRLDNILRLFKYSPSSPVPFALQTAIDPLMTINGDYFSFVHADWVIFTRFACIETYLADKHIIELL